MFAKINKVPVGNNLKVDISKGGIDSYVGEKKSIITRNHVSFILDNGIPGTGFYTISKDFKYDPLFIVFISVIFFMAFCTLNAIAINSSYCFDTFILKFYSPLNILFIFLFILFISVGITSIRHHRNKLYGKFLKYKTKLQNEINSVRSAIDNCSGIKQDILQSYLECLLIEQEINEVEPVVSALENYSNRYSEIHEEYRLRFSNLQKKLHNTRYRVDSNLNMRQITNYYHLCETFELLASSSRFWDISHLQNPFKGHNWARVNFGTGIFDYILSNSLPPIMQTSKNGNFYFYSSFVLHSRNSVDFDIIPLDSIHFEFDYVPGTTHYAVLSELSLNLKFTTSNPEDLKFFIKIFEEYKKGELNVNDFIRKDSLLEEVALYIIFVRTVSYKMISKHFNLVNNRTKRVLSQLEQMKIITPIDENGMRSIIVWDIEKVCDIINKADIKE